AVGVEQGIVSAMILSLFRIVSHSYSPHTGVLALGADGIWNGIPVGPGVVTKPGLAIYRFGANLFYAKANRFAEELHCLAGKSPSPIRWLIVDAEAITHLDYSAARIVQELQRDPERIGVKLGFARMAWELKSDFDRHCLTGCIDSSMIFTR